MSIQRLPASGSIRPVCRPKALETPASVALGRLAAGQSDEARLLFAVELATVLPLRRASVQGRLKTLAALLFANPTDGRLARPPRRSSRAPIRPLSDSHRPSARCGRE